MWFRQLQLYRVHLAPPHDSESLVEALEQHVSHPLGGSQSKRMGWIPPAGRKSEALLHEVSGHRLIRARRQERLLPASVVREEQEERVADLEEREGRTLARQEKMAIKEQIYEEFLPRAFIRSKQVDLWWDTKRQLIGINAGSRKIAEECLDLLRQTLGALKVTPLATRVTPVKAMTDWLCDPESRPTWCQLGDQTQLEATTGDDARFTARQADLDGDEVQSILESGRHATKLALSVQDKAGFVLQDDLSLKGLRFDDALIDEANEANDDGDALVRLETDFLLMADALAELIELLLEALGGEASPTQPPLPEPGSAPALETEGSKAPSEEAGELLAETAD